MTRSVSISPNNVYAFVAKGKYVLHITDDAHDAKTHQQGQGCGSDEAGVAVGFRVEP